LHHHFEIQGWAESKIIIRFWIISMIANIIALITIKIR
jgi:phospho-N-acetylmuramoyl-pentapeptide-transferase